MIEFRATRAKPRRLSVELNPYGSMNAYAWSTGKSYIALAAASEKLDKAVLLADGSPALFIGNAHFPLTSSEAAEVERVFGPLGLRIERKEAQS